MQSTNTRPRVKCQSDVHTDEDVRHDTAVDTSQVEEKI